MKINHRMLFLMVMIQVCCLKAASYESWGYTSPLKWNEEELSRAEGHLEMVEAEMAGVPGIIHEYLNAKQRVKNAKENLERTKIKSKL